MGKGSDGWGSETLLKAEAGEREALLWHPRVLMKLLVARLIGAFLPPPFSPMR